MKAVGLVLLGSVLFLGGGAPAHAQSLLGEVKACSWIEDDAERLACYDRAVKALSGRPTAAPAPPSAARGTDRRSETALPLPSQARESVPPPPARAAGDAEDDAAGERRLTIAEVATDARGKLVLTMNNGEVWAQTDTQRLPPIEPGMTARIEEGWFGGHRLSVTGRTIRVKRLR